MTGRPAQTARRDLIAWFATGAGVAASTAASAVPAVAPAAGSAAGRYDATADFGAVGDGRADDSDALQAAIDRGSQSVRPVVLRPGAYRITRPLKIGPNTMLVGSAPGLGFGCRLEPVGCPALLVGGSTPSFHCSIENLLIWPKGPAADCVVSVDNSYSVTFRNLRIHDAHDETGRAAVVLLGSAKAGGHGPCANVLWDNLIVRNDRGQPHVAILAAPGCGSHRFIAPDIENFGVLLEWMGGEIDLIAPYTERAGRYGVNCSIEPGEDAAYLNTFGGVVDTATSGIGCAIRRGARNVRSFGTTWAPSGARAAYVYDLPMGPVEFHGASRSAPTSRAPDIDGIDGWWRLVRTPDQRVAGTLAVDLVVAAGSRARIDVPVAGARADRHIAAVAINADTMGVLLCAYVAKDALVAVLASNPTSTPLRLRGIIGVECTIL